MCSSCVTCASLSLSSFRWALLLKVLLACVVPTYPMYTASSAYELRACRLIQGSTVSQRQLAHIDLKMLLEWSWSTTTLMSMRRLPAGAKSSPSTFISFSGLHVLQNRCRLSQQIMSFLQCAGILVPILCGAGARGGFFHVCAVLGWIR